MLHYETPALSSETFMHVNAALECIRRHIADGNLPVVPPYDTPTLLDFLQPYSIPEAALRFVLAQEISACCVGFHSEERLRENLRAVARPCLDAARLA